MLKIRKGIKNDLPYILELIKELAEYENSLNEVEITLKELEDDGFGTHPYYSFVVAKENDKVIGMAFYFIRYSTWKGKVLFLEDFIVKKEYRGKGVGAKLFEYTIKIGKDLNVNGMHWQILDWNEPAILFYKKYSATISKEWLNGKLTKKQILDFNC